MRRAFLVFVLSAISLGFPAAFQGQEKSEGNPRRQLHDYLIGCCKEHFDARRQTVAALTTPDDIRQRQESLKAKFLASIGPMPEKTPLNAKVVGTVHGEGFRVEKVIYESRPHHHVTANLYLPDAKGPVPAVLVPCGHSGNGKAYDGYQRVCMLLAKNGIAALCYDPIGQGERRQILDDNNKPGIPSSTNEHTLVGVGGWLVGQGTASYRIWDGIRSIDYLASRPEVDAKKLGCAGNSGGGTMTSYLMALDDRIACAAPSCYITSLERLFATIGPQDAEQNIVGQVAMGLEHADFLTLRAPRPTLMAVATQDFFDIDGAWKTYREANLIYGKLGYPERVGISEYNDKHGFSKPRREATVRWMRRWLLGVDDAVVEKVVPAFKDADLLCTRTGQVLADFKGVSAFDINAKYADQAKAAREKAAKRTGAEFAANVKRAVGSSDNSVRVRGVRSQGGSAVVFDMDGGPKLSGNLYPRKEGVAGDGYRILVLPENRPTGHIDPLTSKFVDDGYDVLEVDLRGLGGLPEATKPSPLGRDSTNVMIGIHLNRPLPGQRMEDVLALVEWWAKKSKDKIKVVGQGETALPVLLAAAVDPRIDAVVLHRGVVSWDNVARTPISMNQLVNVVPGVLQQFDLPDLAASLAPRPLTMRGTVDAAGRTLKTADVEAAYRDSRAAYERSKANQNFRVE